MYFKQWKTKKNNQKAGQNNNKSNYAHVCLYMAMNDLNDGIEFLCAYSIQFRLYCECISERKKIKKKCSMRRKNTKRSNKNKKKSTKTHISIRSTHTLKQKRSPTDRSRNKIKTTTTK